MCGTWLEFVIKEHENYGTEEKSLLFVDCFFVKNKLSINLTISSLEDEQHDVLYIYGSDDFMCVFATVVKEWLYE